MLAFPRYSMFVLACLISILSGVRADEVPIPLDKLPKAVVEAVKKRFPKAELIGAAKETENGKTTYEVTIKKKGKKIDVVLTADGVITVMEKEIDYAKLPKAVKDTLEKKYPKAVYKKVEKVIKVKDGKESLDVYEVQLQTADRNKIEVKVSADGKIKG